MGGATPDPGRPLRNYREDSAARHRCPFCAGLQGKYEGRGLCWLASCDRGPNGTRCGCHHAMTGMTAPSKAEQPKLDSRNHPDPRFHKWARHII